MCVERWRGVLAPTCLSDVAISTDLNTPPQTGASPMPSTCFLCLGRGSALVKTSAVCSGSRQLSTFMVPCCTCSHTQCQQISMCFDLLWNWGFFVKVIAPLLSPSTSIGDSLGRSPSSSYKLRNQQASHADSESATYSASVKDNAVAICFFELQVIAPSATRKTYPVVDLLLSALPYAASAYPYRFFCWGCALYAIPWDRVPARYLRIRFTAMLCCKLGFAM